MLSAGANKLTNLKQQAASYAALIMEELDPDHLGYIEVRDVLRNNSETNGFLRQLMLPSKQALNVFSNPLVKLT